MNGATTHMCEDIVIGILARLPTKSLVRFMAVCRLWKTIITSPQFSLLLERPSKLLLLTDHECYSVLEDEDLLMLEADFPLKHYSYDIAILLGSDNGLLCIGIRMNGRDFHRVIVWNPCIRKHVVIPEPPTNDYTSVNAHGFGATISGSDYKYARVVGSRKVIEIYSLKTGTWRRKNLDDYVCNPYLGPCYTSVLVRGRIHWIGEDCSYKNFIFSFDLEDEVLEHILSPVRTSRYLPWVVVIKESLGLVDFEGGKRLSVWVMEGYGDVHSWIKLFNFDLSMSNCDVIHENIFHLLKNGELLLGLWKYGLLKLMTCDPKTGKTRDFGGLSPSSLLRKLCVLTNYYKESLVLLGNDHHAVAVADHKVSSISEQSIIEDNHEVWYPLKFPKTMPPILAIFAVFFIVMGIFLGGTIRN